MEVYTYFNGGKPFGYLLKGVIDRAGLTMKINRSSFLHVYPQKDTLKISPGEFLKRRAMHRGGQFLRDPLPCSSEHLKGVPYSHFVLIKHIKNGHESNMNELKSVIFHNFLVNTKNIKLNNSVDSAIDFFFIIFV